MQYGPDVQKKRDRTRSDVEGRRDYSGHTPHKNRDVFIKRKNMNLSTGQARGEGEKGMLMRKNAERGRNIKATFIPGERENRTATQLRKKKNGQWDEKRKRKKGQNTAKSPRDGQETRLNKKG